MRRAVAPLAGVLAVAAIVAGVWVWHTATTGRVCDRWQETALDSDGLVGDYPSVEEALVGFGRFPGVRGHLRAESLVPTHDVSPEFGATIQPDKKEGRVYDIWEDGVVVHGTVVLQRKTPAEFKSHSLDRAMLNHSACRNKMVNLAFR